jgi:phosphatidylserine/phosphatidylglycerophosphate/cardiolipin synthase-like enzyme
MQFLPGLTERCLVITQATGSQGQYSVLLSAYRDCDDVFLCWRTFDNGQPEKPIPGNLGFMIERQRQDQYGNWPDRDTTEILRNRVGFTDTPPQDQNEQSQPCNIWPFQRYDWTDHGANSGQTVRYRISPMKLPPGGIAGTTQLQPILTTDWTDPIPVTALCPNGVSAFFNRGSVMSQYVARIARMNNWTPRQIKQHVQDLQEPLRRFLSGELRLALLKLVDEAIDNFSFSLYAALYELDDEELIDRLKKLGSRAHVLLSNGSDKSGDGNSKAATELGDAIDLSRRMLASKGLGHNKFAILYDDSRHKALKAWSGSTNWSTTGLCTQLNNGILFDDKKIADVYYQHWLALEAAHNDFTPALMTANNASPYQPGNGTSIWFTRVAKPAAGKPWARDIVALTDVVNSAKEMVLYVMFEPGEEPLETTLQQGKKGLYVRGVVSTLASSAEESFSLSGVDTKSKEYKTELIQPQGVAQDFASWIKEVTRAQFLYPNTNPGIGHAITHAKMIVIDPGTENCKVVTGSHNFSKSASLNNDENYVVIEGNRQLAEAYAVACMSTYEHYRWRAYLQDQFNAGKKPWSHSDDDPAWQQKYLASVQLKQHLKLWCRDRTGEPPQPKKMVRSAGYAHT